MPVPYKLQLVHGDLARKVTSPGMSRMTGITMHETANRSRGAGAQAHANLQSKGNARKASWHIQVDDKEAIQSYPLSAKCWHAGDGNKGGIHTVAIEVCVNADGDVVQAWKNAAAVVRKLRAENPELGSLLVQHNHWSGKNCPTILRSGSPVSWKQFLSWVERDSGVSPSPATPSRPSPTTQEDEVPKAIKFASHGTDDKEHLYVAFPNAREYEHLQSKSEIGDYENILTQQGFDVVEWKNASGSGYVGNPDGFGRFVGDGVRPRAAKRKD